MTDSISRIGTIAAETVQRCPARTATYSTVIAVAITGASIQATETLDQASALAHAAATRLDRNCITARGMDFAAWVDGPDQPPRSKIVAELLNL